MVNQFLSLSLFLMLLSFFIVMNSISSFEESKTSPVLNSLAAVFSNNTPPNMSLPSPDESPYEANKKGDSLEALEGLFNEEIAGFEPKRNRLGTMMHVRVPMLKLENALDFNGFQNTQIDVERKGSFVQTMVTLLRAEQKGRRYRVDMVLNVAEDPALYVQDNVEGFLKDLKRVSLLAEGLEGQGLPKKMISAGLSKGQSGFIDLYFYRYAPFVMPEDDVTPIKSEEL